ncbi:MAG: tetratricopeptide repeat protein, partial [Planctomycetes bacterium]|nr:tetratricopeptide repeat protein [Planctomycetota bacterium]
MYGSVRRWLSVVAVILGDVCSWQPAWGQKSDYLPAEQEPPTTEPSAAGEETAESSSLPDEEAIGRYQQLLARRPLHAQAFAGLVKYFAEKGTLNQLVSQYEKKAEALPDDVAVRIVLARLYARAGQPEKAADLLASIEAAPEAIAKDEGRWLVFKAEVFQKTNRLTEARQTLELAQSKARSISEKFRLAEAMADLHLSANDKEKSAEALRSLAREYKSNYVHVKRVADALAQRELHAAAVEEYRELLKLAGDKADQRCETLRELGRSLERLGKSQEAIDAYSEAVNLLAGGHWLQQELHERIVTLYRAAGRIEDLVKYCRDQIQRHPEQTGVRMLMADVLAASGDNDGARQVLDEAVKLFPKDRNLSERRVQFLERVGDLAGAASEYERAISQSPDDVELYVAYGQFQANNKQIESARAQWKHVLNSDLADATLAHRLGTLFEPYELLDDAAECYERAVALSPGRAESYAALARLWFVRGDRDKAIASLGRMAQAAPDDASNQASVAQTAGAMGLVDEALKAIERACALDPKSADFLTVRADLLVQAGRLDDALAARREALPLIGAAGQQAQAVNILVSMYGSAGKLAVLKEAEAKRLESNPKDAVALLLLARVGDFERDFVTARGWLTKLLEVDPTHEEGRHQAARMLEATGDVDGAVAAYQKLIDLHPARARQWYQAIADLRLRYQDKAGASETCEKIVQSSPGNASVLKDVAEQLTKMGEVEKAIERYEQSLRIQADRHEIRLAYGNALAEAGRLEEAMAAYKVTALQRTDRDSAMDAMGKLHEVAGRLGA